MRVEKTVFISYRRTNIAWALAVYQYLRNHGYDVFFDYTSINNGDFEQIIIGNIKARAHFLVILTPSALERCAEPNDWLRREIETALDEKRNIVPLMLEGFDYGSPAIAKYLTGKLALLSKYNAVRVPIDYFEEALARVCNNYLNLPLEMVIHPASPKAEAAALVEKREANKEVTVVQKELSAQEWFEKGMALNDNSAEEIQYYSEAIRLKAGYAEAYNNRGAARQAQGDLAGAITDYTEAIRLKPDYHLAYYNRGLARKAQGDLAGALKDYNEAIRLKPDYASAYYNRGIARKAQSDLVGALKDYNEAIRLKPDYVDAYYNRGNASKAQGDTRGAIADYQKYLDLGGGIRDGDQAEVEQMIRDLQAKL